MTRVIICGGRDYTHAARAHAWFDKIHERHTITHVIEGGARGGDRLGRCWAILRGIPFTTVEADWSAHGKRAGYLRNKRMRDEFNPDLVIALPGGVGTKMMIDLAKEKSIPVYEAQL